MRRKIILDCDPGHDDAIAVMLAGQHQAIELLGITVVAGNQTLAKTGDNARRLCEYFGFDVPICLGSSTPLIKDIQVCPDIHGESGLDGFDFPPIQTEYDERRATDFIIETLMDADEKLTIVTTGPMTNLALAIRIEPKIVDQIEEVVLMGGSIGYGNVSPGAEFNIYADPEAAHIVFNSGAKITMIGLDVTRKVLVLPEIIQRIEKINNHVSKLFVDLMNVFNENQRKVFGLPAGPLHDALTIAYLIDQSILETAFVSCEIDISHGPSYGRTNIDVFDYLHLPKSVHVGKDVQVEQFWDIIAEVIASFS